METDGWTLRDWADHAVGELPTVYLQRYVDAFEEGGLVHLTRKCALGRMLALGDGERTRHLDPPLRTSCESRKHVKSRGAEAHPLAIVEVVFEGWSSAVGYIHTGGQNERRQVLYDACIEELARRASVEDLEPTPEPCPA